MSKFDDFLSEIRDGAKHGGIAFAASEVVCRLAVGIRGLLPHVNIPDKATDKHG